ncbi:MAG: polymer-forming cytoskeletal protein [Nitrospiraceae bacterium]
MWNRNDGPQKEGFAPTEDTADQDTNLFANEGADSQVMASIARGMEFKGCLRYSGTVRIDGKMEGEIITDGTVLIGRGAVIFAQVQARKVLCLGQITGDIVASEKVRFLSPAVLTGSVTAPVVAMEEGVLFSGTLEMRQAEQTSAKPTVVRETARDRDALMLAHTGNGRAVAVS